MTQDEEVRRRAADILMGALFGLALSFVKIFGPRFTASWC